MAWPMPTAGQWNPNVMEMTPGMNPGPGSFTPEQWTAMQQQNWQQWAQWQQQYSQWQTQYGDKYAQQMQTMQAMGAMPPLPPQAAQPPAPPLPDAPPPPPPHENNQPLYAPPSSQPTPVPAPTNNQNAGLNNVNPTGNSLQWSQPPRPDATQTSVNADALKKLAEEERLFDIQFQKWEEEIGKWKLDNVNHPDKQAYNEYEQKFEACRMQLLERRQQMNQKKARLLGNIQQGASTTTDNNNLPTSKPPLQAMNENTLSHTMQKQLHQSQSQTLMSINNFNQTMPLVQQPSKQPLLQQPLRQLLLQQLPRQPFLQQPPRQPLLQQPPRQPLLPQPSRQPLLPQMSKQPQNNSNYNKAIPPMPQQSQSYQNEPLYNNSTNRNAQYQQYNNSQANFKRTINKSVDPQDRFEAYQSMEDYSNDDTSGFLPPTDPNKGIPGLDLVPDQDRPAADKQQEVIDITQDQTEVPKIGPDYSTISKGINNILGDEKIMNILSMVLVKGGPAGTESTGNASDSNTSCPPLNDAVNYPPPNNYNMPTNQWNRNNCFNQYGNRQNIPPNRQGQNHPMQQNQPPQNRMYDEAKQNMPEQQHYGPNSQFEDKNLPPRPFQSRPPGPLPMRSNMTQQMAPQIPSLLTLPTGQVDNNRGPNDFNRRQKEFDKGQNENDVLQPQPARSKWPEVQLITPSIIVEYEHKALRLKARDFIEPVHIFEYNHISKDEEFKKKDMNREFDELFTRKPRRPEREDDRFSRDPYSRDYERRMPREEPREEFRPIPLRDEYEDRRRPEPRYDDRHDDRRRDDRDKYSRREDIYKDRERERERERDRDKSRDYRRSNSRERERDRERDSRKRGRSKESIISNTSKKSKEDVKPSPLVHADVPKHIVMIDDILEPPARDMRPAKIVLILRGPPGSGKSYLAKLIRDREAEFDCTARIMSIDDYFMQENEVVERDPATGKMVRKPTMKYEYDEGNEESYLSSLKRAFKRSITDGYFSFLIYDAVNDQLKSYADIWNFARQNGFQVYVCTMEMDPQTCYKRNIHNRSLEDIEIICSRFFPTPAHHIQLDPTNLLQNASITDVHMEDVMNDVAEEIQADELDSTAQANLYGRRNYPWKTTSR